MQKAQRHIKGSPAPHLGGEKLRQGAGDIRGGGEHVEGAHPSSEQGLMCVTHRRVGHLQRGGPTQIKGEPFRTELLETLAGAQRRVSVRQGW